MAYTFKPYQLTASDLIGTLRRHTMVHAENFRPIVSPIVQEIAPLEIHQFVMRLGDGRVYRVRVSDITPEKESVDAS